jgi:predicted secreted acid phosphatase
MVGDDLGDFFSTSGLKPDARLMKTEVDYRERWGRQWIMIPNPTYGSWERAFWTSTDKDIVGKKKEALTCIETVCGKP